MKMCTRNRKSRERIRNVARNKGTADNCVRNMLNCARLRHDSASIRFLTGFFANWRAECRIPSLLFLKWKGDCWTPLRWVSMVVLFVRSVCVLWRVWCFYWVSRVWKCCLSVYLLRKDSSRTILLMYGHHIVQWEDKNASCNRVFGRIGHISIQNAQLYRLSTCNLCSGDLRNSQFHIIPRIEFQS